MPELIDREVTQLLLDTAIKQFGENTLQDRMTKNGLLAARRIVSKQPTIEPEVRHGRWIESQTDLICSVCKWKYSDELLFMSNNGLDSMTEAFAHCPHCGARMDGGADNG